MTVCTLAFDSFLNVWVWACHLNDNTQCEMLRLFVESRVFTTKWTFISIHSSIEFPVRSIRLINKQQRSYHFVVSRNSAEWITYFVLLLGFVLILPPCLPLFYFSLFCTDLRLWRIFLAATFIWLSLTEIYLSGGPHYHFQTRTISDFSCSIYHTLWAIFFALLLRSFSINEIRTHWSACCQWTNRINFDAKALNFKL